jgi:hypothetical protein
MNSVSQARCDPSGVGIIIVRAPGASSSRPAGLLSPRLRTGNPSGCARRLLAGVCPGDSLPPLLSHALDFDQSLITLIPPSAFRISLSAFPPGFMGSFHLHVMCTRCSLPGTFNSTFNFQHSTVNPEPGTLNPESAAFDQKLNFIRRAKVRSWGNSVVRLSGFTR